MAEAQKDPWLDSKLAVRRWDDLAKDPDMTTPPLGYFTDMAVRSLLKSRDDSGGSSVAEAMPKAQIAVA